MSHIKTYIQWIAPRAAIFLMAITSTGLSAADLEVVESFWTSRTTATAQAQHPKVEVDRADGKANFAVTFVNRGRQDINAIRATTSLPPGVKYSTTGQTTAKAIYAGVVRSGESFTVIYPVEFDATFDNRSYRCNIQTEFRQVQPNKNLTESHEAAFRCTGRTNLEVEAKGALEPGLSNQIIFRVTNRGTAKATGVRLTLPTTSSSSPSNPGASISIVGPRSLDITALEPGQSIELSPTLFASRAAAGSIQNIQAALNYQNACNELTSSVASIGVSVYPEPQIGYLDVATEAKTLQAMAGKLTTLNFNLQNHSARNVTNISIAATPSISTMSAAADGSLKIMGLQRWTIASLESKQRLPVPLSVFASRELIGRATAIRFTVQFELQGQPHSQTFEHSIYVDGEVQIKLRESAITMIGGVPNFTGSLLNEGASTAQFSTIEIIECEGWNAKKSSTLYLGDIAENSPLPISIPLDPSGEVETGSYEFHLRVEYKNSLKEIQAIDLRSKVPYAAEAKPISDSTEGNSRLQIPPYLGWLLGGVAIGFVVGRLMFRRNRNQELVQLIQQSKIEGLPSLDDALAMNSSAGTKR